MWTSLATTLVASLSLAAQGVSADASPLEYEVVNDNSMASAMMMGLASQDTIFIMDKVEGNKDTLSDGTPVWASMFDLNDNSVRGIKARTNPFCAAGGVLGNGTWLIAGGNNAVGVGGAAAGGGDGPYNNYDGRLAIRLMNPQSSDQDLEWDDDGTYSMQSPRWYAGIEALADGSIVLIGGAVNGGYINRNYPNVDPAYEGNGQGSVDNINGGANPTYEYWPSKGGLQESNFMIKTSGLNMYAHTYLLPSGRIFMQANYSTTIWNHETNEEEDLPDMPDQIVRVYPASGATAQLPMTKANNYTAPILFCGGAILDDKTWGDYAGPKSNILGIEASNDCSSILPELSDGTTNPDAAYDREEKMPAGRTMGQFIHLPTGQMLIVNGANKGTAGYYNTSFNTVQVNGETVQTEGLAQDPTYKPLLYDPELPKGSRLTDAGFASSQIARLYHSSAILAPDGSVVVAGSNPHVDVVLDMPTGTSPQAFNTTYEIEKWYPSYYFENRPQPSNMPPKLTYGGSPFNVTVDADYMGSNANYKAAATKIMLIRPGFSTHAMNMGQRSMQLEHTYTVNDDGSVQYMINQLPNNPNLFVPGPALLFVTIDGIPSKGKLLMVGDLGNVPSQVSVGSALVDLPAPINSSKSSNSPESSGGSSGASTASPSSLFTTAASLLAAASIAVLAL